MTVLVVGSVLLDVIATYKEDTPPNQIDITGTLDAYRIGGKAYNVAHNLVSLGCRTRLMTYLSGKSFSTSFFRKKLQEEGLLGDFVFFRNNLPEGAFVAHRRGSVVERAVTSTVIQIVNIPLGVIEKALEGVKLLVLDCSLSPSQISAFCKSAKQKSLGIIILGTSDSRVPSLLFSELDPYSIDVLILNKAEFRALCKKVAKLGSNRAIFDDPRKLTKETIIDICNNFYATNVIVTLSEDGMVILDKAGGSQSFDGPSKGQPVISTTGARDALSAVVAGHYLNNSGFDWAKVNREIRPRVLSTLLFQGATPNCEALLEDI